MFKKDPKLAVFRVGTAIASVLLLVATYLAYLDFTFTQRATNVPGLVTEIIKNPSGDTDTNTLVPIISYQKDNQTLSYTSTFGRYPSPYKVGDSINLLIDNEDQSHISINSFIELYGDSLIILGIATVFGFIGLFFGLSRIHYKKLEERLKKNGIQAEANFTSIQPGNFLINNQRSFIIHASYIDPKTGKTIDMESTDLWQDPTSFIPQSKKISVYLDRKDANLYIMDTSFVPNHV